LVTREALQKERQEQRGKERRNKERRQGWFQGRNKILMHFLLGDIKFLSFLGILVHRLHVNNRISSQKLITLWLNVRGAGRALKFVKQSIC